MILSDEHQYLSHVSNIIRMGDVKTENRNGETKEMIGISMRFNLREMTLPLLTTKTVSWKTVLKELLFFIRGETDNRILQAQNVRIWTNNSTCKFLDSCGLDNYPEGNLGPVYGKQWRDFNGKHIICYCPTIQSCVCQKVTENENRIDQLQDVIDKLKNPKTRFSRRLVVSAWNPCQIKEMCLPPCHLMFQFIVNSNNELNCIMTQRSADMGLGVPYNITSYAFLTHLVAHHCGIGVGELIINIGSAHIYKEHIGALSEQVHRTPDVFPKLKINTYRDKIEDYQLDDFEVIGYVHQSSIHMEMKA